MIMQAKYKHKWTSGIDDDDVHALSMLDWQEALAGLTDEQIKTGISKLPTGNDDWPPLAGAFRELCEGKTESWEHNTAAYKRFDRSKAIEKKPDLEKVKPHREEVRRLVRLTQC